MASQFGLCALLFDNGAIVPPFVIRGQASLSGFIKAPDLLTCSETLTHLPVGKSLVYLFERLGMGCYMTAEAEFQAPTAGDESPGKVDKLLDDRFNPPAFGIVTDDALCADQRNLADETQDVVHQSTTGHDKLVHGKFARRQQFKVHVGLDFGMVLLAESMPLVQFDDLLAGELQACPPPFKLMSGSRSICPFLSMDRSITRMTRQRVMVLSIPSASVKACLSFTLNTETRLPGRGVVTFPLIKPYATHVCLSCLWGFHLMM